MPDTHHTSGAVPGRDAPLRVIYSSPPALCCLGWVKTTPAENITSGAELRRCRGEQDVEGPGEGAARAGVGRHSAVPCRGWKAEPPGAGEPLRRLARCRPVPHALPGAGQSRARRLLPHCPCPCPIPLDDNQHLVRNPQRLRVPWPQSPVLCGEHILF